MARKSAQLRLSQSVELYENYKSSGIEHSRKGRFIKDMITRIENKKSMSKKMRSWLDSLINEGVPEPKGDKELLEEIKTAWEKIQKDFGYSWQVQTLKDFYGYIRYGYNLTEKQKNLMNNLIEKSKQNFVPNEEQAFEIECLVKIYNSYSGSWRNMRPAVFKAVEQATLWLNGESKIAEWNYEKMKNAMGSRLKAFKNAKFKSGDIGWITISKNEKLLCTAVSDCYLDDKGNPVNDWMLCNGEFKTQQQSYISKRK